MDLDNFIIGKTKKRRGEERGDLAKKTNICLANIVQQLMAKDRTTSPGRVLGDLAKKSNSSHLGVASSKTSSRSSKRRRSRSSKRRRSRRRSSSRSGRSRSSSSSSSSNNSHYTPAVYKQKNREGVVVVE